MAREPKAGKTAPAPEIAADPHDAAATVAHALIAPDRLNPRTAFDDGGIEELAASIVTDGLLQPLLVRPAAAMENYGQPMHRLVAGERRWRAIGLLIVRGQWPADRPVPVTVREMTDEAHLRLALIENLQRRDLKPLEEARGYQRLMTEFNLSTAQVAGMVKFGVRMIQKRLQLLECDESDQQLLDEGRITIEEALRRLANRPKPYDLPADQALAFLEVATVIARSDNPTFWNRVPCDWRIADDETITALKKRWVVETRDDYHTGHTLVGLAYNARRLLAELTGQDDLDTARIETALVGARAAAGLAADHWATPALTSPFEISPESLAAVARRAEQEEADKVTAAARKAEASARVAAVQAVRRTVEKAVTGKAADPALVTAIEGTGVALPVRVRNDSLEDANGRVIAARNYYACGNVDRESALRLMAIAINAACGFAKTPKPAPAEGAAADDAANPSDDDDDDIDIDIEDEAA